MIFYLARLIILAVFMFIISMFGLAGYGVYKASNGLDFNHGLSGVVHHVWTGKPLPADDIAENK